MSDDRSKTSEIMLFFKILMTGKSRKIDALLLYEVAILSNLTFFFPKITKYSDYLQNISGKL